MMKIAPRAISLIFLVNSVFLQNVNGLMFTEETTCHQIDPNMMYYCPTQRYCGWTTLNSQEKVLVRAKLGYNMNVWNYVNINEDIEKKAFSTLNADEQEALEIIGFHEDSHDCCHGHYEDYAWSDFDMEGYEWVKAAWATFGYNETTWDNGVLLGSVDQWWDDLTEEQQTAMSGEACYTRELWNQVSMPLWADDATLPGTFEATLQPTLEPTNGPTTSPTKQPSSNPTTNPTKLSTVMPTSSPPSNVPTEMPSLTLSESPTEMLSEQPTVFESSVPSSQPSISSIESSVPSSQPSISSNITDSLSITTSTEPANETSLIGNILTDISARLHNETSTNITSMPLTTSNTTSPTTSQTASPTKSSTVSPTKSPSTSPTKSPSTSPTKSPSTSPTKSPSTSPTTFPTTSPTKSPSKFPTASPTFAPTDTTPSPTATPTDEPTLSPTITVSESPSLIPINIQEFLTPCRELDENTFYYCPSLRYCDWEGQSLTTIAYLRETLGYDRNSWNFYTKNSIEASWFEDLPSSQQRGLENLGFDGERHECCMNHYELYGWNDFDQWGLSAEKAAWETLGYDQEKWDTAVSTEFDDLWFAELPEDVQTALEDFLCYTEELWNEVPLDFWLEDAMVPGSFSDESVESSLGVSLRSEIQWWSFLNICTLSVAIYSFV